MKIESRSAPIADKIDPGAGSRLRAAAEPGGEAASPHARVAISPRGRELAARAAEEAPDEARTRRVLDLKKAVEGGSYETDSREVARRMLRRNFLDLIV